MSSNVSPDASELVLSNQENINLKGKKNTDKSVHQSMQPKLLATNVTSGSQSDNSDLGNLRKLKKTDSVSQSAEFVTQLLARVHSLSKQQRRDLLQVLDDMSPTSKPRQRNMRSKKKAANDKDKSTDERRRRRREIREKQLMSKMAPPSRAPKLPLPSNSAFMETPSPPARALSPDISRNGNRSRSRSPATMDNGPMITKIGDRPQ